MVSNGKQEDVKTRAVTGKRHVKGRSMKAEKERRRRGDRGMTGKQ